MTSKKFDFAIETMGGSATFGIVLHTKIKPISTKKATKIS